jgi:hypothetical protein
MSVRDKIVDAQLLYANGRKEGALLSVLVAVAATSRKRYPLGTKKDGDAFTSFLGEELTKVLRIGTYNVKFRSEMITLQDLLYKFVRCNLTHEAILPNDIIFEKGDTMKVSVDDNKITFSDRLIEILAQTVCNAEENKDEFKEVKSNG